MVIAVAVLLFYGRKLMSQMRDGFCDYIGKQGCDCDSGADSE